MGCDELSEQNRTGSRVVDLPEFWMDVTEVTNLAYEKIFPEHKERRHETSQCDDCPVTRVSWFQAREYCKALDKDLPTEEQWEKSAGALDSCGYSWGAQIFAGASDARGSGLVRGGFKLEEGASPVASYPPNRFGIYDISGNVWEWTSTAWGPFKVRRGGAWSDDIRGLRVSWRDWSDAHATFFVDVGFRCARNL